MLHMPSAATTQHPTRATSPIGAGGAVAEAAEAVDTEAQPPHGGAMEEAEQTVQPPHGGTLTKTEPTVATHQLLDCGTHFCRLRITDKKVIAINHNPKHAAPDVNASMPPIRGRPLRPVRSAIRRGWGAGWWRRTAWAA